MLAAAGAALVGLLVDPRVITGAPAWLKPFKFAVSTAIYSLTLAWIFGWLSGWPRVRRAVGWVTAVVFVLEVAHHRRRRPGAERPVTSTCRRRSTGCCSPSWVRRSCCRRWSASAVAVALWRQRFTDRTLGWALTARA